jgi:hypothetical protein
MVLIAVTAWSFHTVYWIFAHPTEGGSAALPPARRRPPMVDGGSGSRDDTLRTEDTSSPAPGLEFPRVNAATCRQAEIDAVMCG